MLKLSCKDRKRQPSANLERVQISCCNQSLHAHTLSHALCRDICSLCCQYRSQHRLTVAILPVLSAVLTVRTPGCCKAPLLLLPHVNKVYSAKSCSRRMADTAVQRPCLSTSSVINVSGSHKSVWQHSSVGAKWPRLLDAPVANPCLVHADTLCSNQISSVWQTSPDLKYKTCSATKTLLLCIP